LISYYSESTVLIWFGLDDIKQGDLFDIEVNLPQGPQFILV